MKLPKSVWLIVALLGLLAQPLQAYPPAPASQAQVNEGVQSYLYITPATLRGLDPTNYPNLSAGNTNALTPAQEAKLDAAVTTNSIFTNAPILDAAWNASAQILPSVRLKTWGTGKDQAQITNAINFIYTNGLFVDGVLFDEGIMARRTNGVITNTPAAIAPYYCNMPNGIVWMIDYCHARNLRADVWLSRYQYNPGAGDGTNAYVGSPGDLLPFDMETCKGYGFDGFQIDHVATAYPADLDRYESWAFNAVAQKIQSWAKLTNNLANGTLALNPKRYPVGIYGMSGYPFQNWVNQQTYGGDIFLNNNFPAGPYTNGAFTANARQFVSNYTNFYSRPGSVIDALEFDPDATPAFESTNTINICAIMAASFDLDCRYDIGRSFAMSQAGCQALTNVMIRAIHRDPLVKMGRPIYATNNIELWKKDLVDGRKGLMVWNCNTNGPATNFTFNASQFMPFAASVVLTDPWTGLTIATNTSFTLTLSSNQTRLLLASEYVSGGGAGATITGLARNLSSGSGISTAGTAQGDGTTNWTITASGLSMTNFSEFPVSVIYPTTQHVWQGSYRNGSVAAGATAYYSWLDYSHFNGRTNVIVTANIAFTAAGTNQLNCVIDQFGKTNTTQRLVQALNFSATAATNFTAVFSGYITPATTPGLLDLQLTIQNISGTASFDAGAAKIYVY